MTSKTLHRTPLYGAHLRLKAQMVEFAGWDMPLQYTGIIEEHRTVRSRAGVFDVSHLGRFEITGSEAQGLLQLLLVSDISLIDTGQAKYSLLCQEDGGILDDVILYCLAPGRYLLVCNAVNTHAVSRWLARWSEGFPKAKIADISLDTAMIALQGPRAHTVLASIWDSPLADTMGRYTCTVAELLGKHSTVVTRTGYSGEDGYELVVPQGESVAVWELLLGRGAKPCGLGARDTLRLEAGLLLYGHEMDATNNPFQVGLGPLVAWEKGDFVGREALLALQKERPRELLVGFEMVERGVPRQHYPLVREGERIGVVTSGGYAPSLDRYVGMGYIASKYAAPGQGLQVDIRGKLLMARVVPRPFYRRHR